MQMQVHATDMIVIKDKSKLRGKFAPVGTCIKKWEWHWMNNLSMNLKDLGKQAKSTIISGKELKLEKLQFKQNWLKINWGDLKNKINTLWPN